MRTERLSLVAVVLALWPGAARAAISTFDQQLIEQSQVSDPEFGDGFGDALAVGDFDGDDYPDLAVGASSEDFGGFTASGAVSIYYGGPAGLDDIQGVVQGAGTVPGTLDDYTFFGRRLAVGDFDDDGYDDLAIGSWTDVGAQSQAGAVTVLYGAPGGLSDLGGGQEWTQATAGVPGVPETQEFFGDRLATGDFDGNGADDLAIGSGRDNGPADDAGSVTILYGGASGLSTSGIDAFTGNSLGCASASAADELGSAVAAGDFNADGRDDLAIGVPGEDDVPSGPTLANAGLVVVVPGSATGLVAGSAVCLYPGAAIPGGVVPGTRAAGNRFGRTLAAGNFDRNVLVFHVHDDLAISSPYGGSGAAGAGEVTILKGTASGLAASGGFRFDSSDIVGLPAPSNLQNFGSELHAVRATGNPSHDLLVHWHPEGPDGVGYGLVVIPGTAGGLDLDRALPLRSSQSFLLVAPGQSDDRFGYSAAVGDFDRNGYADLAIGDPNKNLPGATWAGVVLVMKGALFADNFETGDTRLWSSVSP